MKYQRLPEWLKKPNNFSKAVHVIKKSLRASSLKTVCEEARCPNLCECFERKRATFMIMGNICTRNCAFCAVKHGDPAKIDPYEPDHLAHMVKNMQLNHVVITSVSRDDLGDGGAAHFACSVLEIRRLNPDTTIELLIPDLQGKKSSLKIITDSKPNILNHNLETVGRLTSKYRDKRAGYEISLNVLRSGKELLKDGLIKTGILVGLGETLEDIKHLFKDVLSTGCDIITIGQYLRPGRNNPPVVYYVTPDEFKQYEKMAYDMGFKHVFSGPFVRSSYMADSLSHIKGVRKA